MGECRNDEGRGGWESCAADAVVHDEVRGDCLRRFGYSNHLASCLPSSPTTLHSSISQLYLNFVCDSHETCTQGACYPSPATRMLPPPFESCDPLAPPPTTDAWEGLELKDVSTACLVSISSQ